MGKLIRFALIAGVLYAGYAIHTQGLDQAFGGALAGLTEEEAYKKVEHLASILDAAALLAVHVTMYITAFEAILAPGRAKPFNQYYFLGYHSMILAMCRERLFDGASEPFQIIFDEHPIFGDRARAEYPVVRQAVKETYPPAIAPVIALQ